MHTPTPKGFFQPKGLTDEKAARMLTAFRDAGSTLRPFTVKVRRFMAYCDANPDYARQALPLLEANRKAADWRKGNRLRSKTHCKYGHSLDDARVNRRPSTGYTQRQCRACGKLWANRPEPLHPEQLKLVQEALLAKRPISEITGRPRGGKRRPMLVDSQRFYKARWYDPEFDLFVRQQTAGNHCRAQKLRWSLYRTRAATAEKREQANDYQKIRAMVPAYLPDRDDVAQDIFLALREKSLKREDVGARVKWYIADHSKRFPPKFRKLGDSPLVSLDEQIFEDGATTRGDTISRGLWD